MPGLRRRSEYAAGYRSGSDLSKRWYAAAAPQRRLRGGQYLGTSECSPLLDHRYRGSKYHLVHAGAPADKITDELMSHVPQPARALLSRGKAVAVSRFLPA